MVLLRTPISRPGTLAPLLQAAIPSFAVASTSRLTLASPPTFSTSSLASAAQPMPSSFIESVKARNAGTYNRPSKLAKVVLLTNLPTTATPTDIRSLALQPKTANDVGRIEYIYTKSLRPSGKALVSFSSPFHASAFESSVHRRILGGKMLSASLQHSHESNSFLRKTYGRWPPEYQLPMDLIEYETGKLVLLSNIPHETFEARLEERLAGRYELRQQDRWRGKRTSYVGYELDQKGYGGTHDAVLGGVLKLPKWHSDATTCSFLVRCQTQAEAMRLVRRWHNTFWAPASFDIQDTGGRYRVAASILY